MKMKITVGIPAYNEEKNIAGIITKLKKYTNDIIVCDDGSDDLTKEIAAELGAEERNIMAMTGHKTTQMVRRYIHEANLFKNNALNKIKI